MKRISMLGMAALALCIMGIILLKAQTLTNIPGNLSNTSFGSVDEFASVIVRPALSIWGLAAAPSREVPAMDMG
jgi:hypothetical protein